MLTLLLEPFHYEYMRNALLASTVIGGVCAFLSAFLVLKGWSLIGNALSHSVVPGVAGAYALGLPFSVGAFFSGFLASVSIMLLRRINYLREDANIGFVFTTFFAAGMLIISLNPTSVSINAVIFGNILTVSRGDLLQIFGIVIISTILLALFWKHLLLTFFDEHQAVLSGVPINALKIMFFSILSACIVASLQAVGAILVIAMVITPGATAYLLTDRFGKMLIISILIGLISSAFGVYLSYYLDGMTGGLIVLSQTFLFIGAFLLAPKYGLLRQNRQIRLSINTAHQPTTIREQVQ